MHLDSCLSQRPPAKGYDVMSCHSTVCFHSGFSNDAEVSYTCKSKTDISTYTLGQIYTFVFTLYL